MARRDRHANLCRSGKNLMAYTFDRRTDARRDTPSSIQPEDEGSIRLPNSLVSRIMEDQQAENEADKLSQGVTSATPDALRAEMGSRLGADFSDVQFHSDSLSRERSRAMGAKGWASGRDVYFGKGGFDPKVAAHELVHTVQQGAVKGDASVSMPYGAVQLDEDDDDKVIRTDQDPQNQQQGNQQQNGDEPAIREIESKLFKFFGTDEGAKVYTDFSGKIKSLLNARLKKKEYRYSAKGSVRLMVRAAYRDYALRDILLEIVKSPVTVKSDRKERAREYKALVKTLSDRLTASDVEELAIETGMFTGVPKYSHTRDRGSKRAYEIQADENGRISYNPNNVKELGKVQEAIDHAESVEQAYNIFAAYTGNPGGRFKDRYKNIKVDIQLFRNKLKNMARVVTDYPELKHMIGDMTTVDPKTDALMSTIGTRGGKREATFEYNKKEDREGPQFDQARALEDEAQKKAKVPFHSSPRDYHGTHEMGHVLASFLVESSGEREARFRNTHSTRRINDMLEKKEPLNYRLMDSRPLTNQIMEEQYELPENDMLESVLANNDGAMLKKYKLRPMGYMQNATVKNHHFLKGMVAVNHDQYQKSGATSEYGSYSAGEMFAEAVADVYAHGKQARAMSIELVKEYEKRGKDKAREKYNENKKSWWRRFFGL